MKLRRLTISEILKVMRDAHIADVEFPVQVTLYGTEASVPLRRKGKRSRHRRLHLWRGEDGDVCREVREVAMVQPL